MLHKLLEYETKNIYYFVCNITIETQQQNLLNNKIIIIMKKKKLQNNVLNLTENLYPLFP